mmetsp:Transcript_18674/g.43393  ORF Transcript_18674/g.43393 Transcript_18674/m.43393 type:complete len:211 (+) Transcript_18674:196-828(+)
MPTVMAQLDALNVSPGPSVTQGLQLANLADRELLFLMGVRASVQNAHLVATAALGQAQRATRAHGEPSRIRVGRPNAKTVRGAASAMTPVSVHAPFAQGGGTLTAGRSSATHAILASIQRSQVMDASLVPMASSAILPELPFATSVSQELLWIWMVMLVPLLAMCAHLELTPGIMAEESATNAVMAGTQTGMAQRSACSAHQATLPKPKE